MAISTGKVVALIQAMGGGADPAVIEAKVQDWLDAHPEATTTVQDGSITEQKLATSIAQKLGLISSLSDEIDALDSDVTDLKSAINYSTALNYSIQNSGKYIDLGNGSDSLISVADWGNVVVKHIPINTKFYLKLYNNGSGRGKAWRWRASDGTWGTSAPAITGTVEIVITAPSDDCSLYCNSLTTGGFLPIVSVFMAAEQDISDLQSEINGGTFLERVWEVGSISSSTGENSSGSSRIRCNKFYATKGTTITVDSSSYNYYVYKYDLHTDAYTKVMNDYATYGTTYVVDEDCYIRIVMNIDGSSANIGAGQIPSIVAHLSIVSYGIIKRVKDNTDLINNPVYYKYLIPELGLEKGKGIDATTGQDTTNANRARTKNYINGLNRIEISIASGYKFVVQHYYNNTTDATTWVTTYDNQSPTGTYRIVVAHNNVNTAMTDQDIIDCALTVRTTRKSNNLETFLSLKLDKEQPDKINKFLYVDSTGQITGVNLSIDPTAPVHARVGTYNIGHYSEGQQTPAGTAENAINFRKAIADMGASLLGTNENDEHFDAAGTMTPRDMVFANWKYYNVGPLQTYSMNGFASDYALTNVGKIEFTQTTRYAWYADVDIGGKSVHVVSAHLDFNDITKRRGQISTLIQHCSEYDSCIVMGDFNPFNYTNNTYNDDGNNKTVWETDYKMWTDAGYKLANAGYLGVLATIVQTSVHGWEGLPCDNIIVTPNIEIRQVGMITMDYMHDHKPIWADLVIY